VLAQRLADQWADREVRHVVVVHHVEMHEVGAGRDHRVHLLAQPREIRGQDRGSNPEITLAIHDTAHALPAGWPALTLPCNAALSTRAATQATATAVNACR